MPHGERQLGRQGFSKHINSYLCDSTCPDHEPFFFCSYEQVIRILFGNIFLSNVFYLKILFPWYQLCLCLLGILRHPKRNTVHQWGELEKNMQPSHLLNRRCSICWARRRETKQSLQCCYHPLWPQSITFNSFLPFPSFSSSPSYLFISFSFFLLIPYLLPFLVLTYPIPFILLSSLSPDIISSFTNNCLWCANRKANLPRLNWACRKLKNYSTPYSCL